MFEPSYNNPGFASHALERSRTTVAERLRCALPGACAWTGACLLGILFEDLHGGGVHDANDAFLRMVGHGRDALEAGAIDWTRMTPPEHEAQDERVVEELRRTGTHVPVEKESPVSGRLVWAAVRPGGCARTRYGGTATAARCEIFPDGQRREFAVRWRHDP
jgi:PAS domain-containing protein